jgi:hypothetical protein
MFPWLTLDESTLFYWTLSDAAADPSHKKRKHISAINKWASSIPAKSTSKAAKSTTSGRAKSDTVVPSLTSGTSGRSYAPSVLSDEVKIISQHSGSSGLVKVEAEPASALDIYSDGGLSDNDEIRGEEREVAINSPLKGKKRITSEVFFSLLV